MALTDLNKSERFIFDWQYRLSGDFKRVLAEVISRADSHNLKRLEKGFPDEVNGYRKFAYKEGWWQRVVERAHERTEG